MSQDIGMTPNPRQGSGLDRLRGLAGRGPGRLAGRLCSAITVSREKVRLMADGKIRLRERRKWALL